MAASDIVARAVALIGGAAILLRRQAPGSETPAVGTAPAIPEARPQGVPTLKMPTARGWAPGRTPAAAPGLRVNAFATGLKHPRWIHVLPNGDVLTAEALSEPGGIRTAFDYAIYATMKRAAATGASPNRITLLRDADGDGVAEVRETFLDGPEPAVRHGVGGRDLLRRQHRRGRGLPLCRRRDPDRRAGASGGCR